MTQVLNQIPDAQKLMLKAAGTLMRRPKGRPALPELAVQVGDVGADAKHLAAYAEVCGFQAIEQLPITFPHVMAGALHLHLMTQKSFPFPMLGLVHIRNDIRQVRPLGANERFDLHVRIGESRDVRQGIEFDLQTEARIGDQAIWSETSTILHRMPGPTGGATQRPAADPATLADYRQFNAPTDIGRRYASVGLDYNPIHLSPIPAKLFGFKRHIAHGMWSMARCAALLEPELGAAPTALKVQFKQPLFLPGRVALKFEPAGKTLRFALLSSSSSKTHLSGELS